MGYFIHSYKLYDLFKQKALSTATPLQPIYNDTSITFPLNNILY
jgi:plasmid replication initiation protein